MSLLYFALFPGVPVNNVKTILKWDVSCI